MTRGAAYADGIYCACMDARREQIYNAVFSVVDGKLLRLSEDRAISIEELGAELKNLEKAIFLVGDGAELCYNTLRVSIPALCLLPEHLRGQHASGTALAAQAKIDAGEPGSGLELIERMKGRCGCEFIILSGYDQFEYAKKAVFLGVKGYILKPLDEEESGHRER